jgi:hypothetical protein
MSAEQGLEGQIERREEPANQEERDKKQVRFWLDALALAGDEEKPWRTAAEKVVQRYRGEGDYALERFRLLYSNVQTMAPALFNSMPIPDIRRRFGDRDEDARNVAQALERTLSCNAEKSDLETVMKEGILHRLLPGRCVIRIRYEPQFTAGEEEGQQEELANESVAFECVPWTDFRRGPAKRWKEVPWIAFRLFPTREQLEKLSPKHGSKVPLNAKVGSEKTKDDERNPPSLYKRAEVWQIWDRDTHKLIYVADGYEDAPLAELDDPLKLENFFPTPEPLLAVRSPDDLRPITEYEQYASLAEELEDITTRLKYLVKAAKWRGVVAKELGPAFAAMADAADGVFTPAEDGITFSNEGGIDKAIWVMPIVELVSAIQQLYEAREQVKTTIYEVTGLADIIRGSTQPSETATAQQIKSQWGSLRLQEDQGDVQRYVRDLFRLAVEIIATKFDPKSVMLASGVQLTEQQVQLMRRDVMREYRIDVETDSTIRADLSRQQENIGQFVQGFGALVTALGPVVQEGTMPGDVAADILTGFARSFKLGRQAEEALERLGDQARQAAKNPQPKPSPEEQKAQAQMAMMQQKAQLDAQKQQQDMAMEQQRNAMEMQMKQAELAFKEKELELKAREMEMKAQATQQQMALDAQGAQQEHTFKMQAMQEQAQFDSQERSANATHQEETRAADLAFMKQKQAMKPANGATQ